MLVSMEEAKKKTCMMTLASELSAKTCRASGCMAWREAALQTPAVKGKGYCGMAGPLDKIPDPTFPTAR